MKVEIKIFTTTTYVHVIEQFQFAFFRLCKKTKNTQRDETYQSKSFLEFLCDVVVAFFAFPDFSRKKKVFTFFSSSLCFLVLIGLNTLLQLSN